MLSSTALEEIISHLGGETKLADIGARDFSADDAHVSFKLAHSNPKSVRSVTISKEPGGFFAMDCFGAIMPGTFKARHIGSASSILAENLATVLGQLTGIDSLHHRHF